MFNLTREEKLVLVFLVASFIVGYGVSFYKKRSLPLPAPIESEGEAKKSDRDECLKRVNVNTAGFDELVKLKGIGAETASRIIDYRQKNGPFFLKEDLMKVKGIGKTKFNLIKEGIVVE